MIKLNGEEIKFGHFPNNESWADLESNYVKFDDTNEVLLRFEGDEDLIHLRFLKDTLDYLAPNTKKVLKIPYMPYSRMDRVENKRMFTLKSVAAIINQMKFDSVKVYEPHSDVTTLLIENIEVHNTSKRLAVWAMRYACDSGLRDLTNSIVDISIKELPKELSYGLRHDCLKKRVVLVYPDAGAKKRYSDQIDYPNYTSAIKVREFDTGKIRSIELEDNDIRADVAIIVDDLCSKGGTFIGVAERLKEKGVQKILLCVAHCEPNIFNGSIIDSDVIDNVFTTDSIISLEEVEAKGNGKISLYMMED